MSTFEVKDDAGNVIFTVAADYNAVILRNKKKGESIWIHADAANGGSGIELRDQKGNATIQLDGDSGDIRLLNADCAEDFDIMEVEPTECGTVMSLNDLGRLEMSRLPYDKRVAGVVSGGGDLKPGLILGRQAKCKDRMPIALIGKVHCKVDADYGSIGVGDLLTTSLTPGYAMKASDPAKSFGAVIGKALQPLKAGHDLIPILVALQ